MSEQNRGEPSRSETAARGQQQMVDGRGQPAFRPIAMPAIAAAAAASRLPAPAVTADPDRGLRLPRR